jgi:ATP-dependent helicase IRC3
MQLRPYQEQALEAIVQNYKAGVRQQLLILATGLGKTCIAASLPETLKEVLPGKMLFIAHTDELCAQTVDKMRTWNPLLKVGLEKAGSHAAPDSDIIVSCNASIGREGSTRMDAFWKDISVIVADECHRILGDSWMRILDDSGVLKPESRKLLVGLSATPKRRNKVRTTETSTTLDDEDLVSLKSVFSKIVFTFPIRKGIKEGFLARLRGYRVSTATNLDGIKVVAGDFQADQLSNAVNTPERNALVVKSWKDNAAGRQTLAFTCSVQHAKDLSEMFLHNGVMAQPIYGADPQRADKLKWFEEKSVQVLCNCMLLTEGFDSPSVSCIALAKPTRSGSAYTQMVGRGTRLDPGKTDCVVLDFCDCYKKCSLVTLPSLLGLSPTLDLQGTDLVKAAEALEAAQEKYPGVSFEGLTDITKIKAYVESIDLFANPYDEEVLEHTKLAWMRRADASYALAIPESKELSDSKQYARFLHEKLIVSVNELSEYELSITTTEMERRLGTYATLQEAFTSAEEVIQRCRPSRVKLLLRDAPWHAGPASEPAKRYLRKLTKKRPLLRCLCEGLHPGKCAICGKPGGLTAGEAALALNVLKSK